MSPSFPAASALFTSPQRPVSSGDWVFCHCCHNTSLTLFSSWHFGKQAIFPSKHLQSKPLLQHTVLRAGESQGFQTKRLKTCLFSYFLIWCGQEQNINNSVGVSTPKKGWEMVGAWGAALGRAPRSPWLILFISAGFGWCKGRKRWQWWEGGPRWHRTRCELFSQISFLPVDRNLSHRKRSKCFVSS